MLKSSWPLHLLVHIPEDVGLDEVEAVGADEAEDVGPHVRGHAGIVDGAGLEQHTLAVDEHGAVVVADGVGGASHCLVGGHLRRAEVGEGREGGKQRMVGAVRVV